MIKIDYKNSLALPDEKEWEPLLEKIKAHSVPEFEAAKPELEYIKATVKKYKKYKNIILAGNGGSRTSSHAYYHSLREFRNKAVFEFIGSAEPQRINAIKKKFSPKDTLVLAVSKSGKNINTFEPFLYLLNYPSLVITEDKENALYAVAKKMGIEIIFHPEVGGRYSGMTTCALVPACLMGLDIHEIYQGASDGYKKFSNKSEINKNEALKLSVYLAELEKKGYTEIMASVYSTPLFAFYPLMVQLIHESTGKDGKGQTIFGDYSPEAQHHTHERYFGGRRNLVGLFMSVEKTVNDTVMKVPKKLADIILHGAPIGKLAGIRGSETMKYDRQGAISSAISKKIAAIDLRVSEVTPRTMGEFLVFWQYVAMYSALLRGQNPFDQPAVEQSKQMSYALRIKH